MSTYIPGFINPYPGGWKNYPNVDTPIIAASLQSYSDALEHIEYFLKNTDIDPTTISTLPSPSEDLVNRIYQYSGETNEFFTNGFFYKCVYDEHDETYIWTLTRVQPLQGTPTAAEVSYDAHISGLTAQNVQDGIDILARYISNIEGLIDVINGEVI